MSERNGLLDLRDGDRVQFTGFKNLSVQPGSTSQLAVARDQFVQALTPDKSLVLFAGPYGVDGFMVGIALDVIEAVPGVASSLIHVGAAAVKGARLISGWDAGD